MFCASCGSQVEDTERQCPQCQAPVITPPPGLPGQGDTYYVQIFGSAQGPYEIPELQMMVRTRQIKADTMIMKGNGNWFRAADLPGLFSSKSWTTSLILAILLPGIDLIYLGYAGLGVLKLITCGGAGIWWIIDIVRLANHSLPDSDGLPLSQ